MAVTSTSTRGRTQNPGVLIDRFEKQLGQLTDQLPKLRQAFTGLTGQATGTNMGGGGAATGTNMRGGNRQQHAEAGSIGGRVTQRKRSTTRKKSLSTG